MSNAEIQRLKEIMASLRDPETGCPWDIQQTHQTLRKYVLEEAYEVVDAIDSQNDEELKSELGDLLLQVIFHAEIAEKNGKFNFEDIAKTVNEKMIRRHPHVFGNADKRDVKAQNEAWENVKALERESKGERGTLEGIARALPALVRAEKLQKRAASVGFDWDNIKNVKNKIIEELDEIENASDQEKEGEFGDLMFALVNWARHQGISAESAISLTNEKFIKRFHYIEDNLKQDNQNINDASLEVMEKLWQEAKSKLSD